MKKILGSAVIGALLSTTGLSAKEPLIPMKKIELIKEEIKTNFEEVKIDLGESWNDLKDPKNECVAYIKKSRPQLTCIDERLTDAQKIIIKSANKILKNKYGSEFIILKENFLKTLEK